MTEDPTPFHVLVADDEPMLRSVIGEFLDTLDFCTYGEASDGIEALDYLRAHPVDCLLSDARMPRMDLEELLKNVGREFPDTIVIATSGYSDLESACRILDLGAHEFLAKPLNLDLLERSLEWVPRRAHVLSLAHGAFNGAERDMSLNYAHPMRSLGEALVQCGEPFRSTMEHARRCADLAVILAEGESDALRNELQLAALLHEIGCSSQQLVMHATPRSLLANERRFVRIHARVGGRLLGRALSSRLAGEIVSRHVDWSTSNAAEERGWDTVQRLACLLGVANAIDGLMQDRADRPHHDIEQAHAVLKTLYSETSLSVIKQALSHWPRVMSYYSEASSV